MSRDEWTRLRAIDLYNFIRHHPGLKPAAVARKMAACNKYVLNGLVFLERHRLLVYEDDKGRLYPF